MIYFSIITITYNAEKWLKNTILSVIKQTYPYIEYIIIDGNSTDKTVEIIKHYSAGISYWVSEPDNGLYDAMNKGLSKATGEYVWFLNAGDTLYSCDTIKEIVGKITKRNKLPDIIYGETSIIDENNTFVATRRLKAPRKLTWKSFQMGMLVCHQSFVSKREIAPLYNTDYKLASDFDWCIQCMKQAKVIYNTNMILSNFLENGISSLNRKKVLKERYKIMCRYYGYIPTILFHGWFAIRFYWAKLIKRRV